VSHHQQSALCQADGTREEVDSRDEVMHIANERLVIFRKDVDAIDGRDRVTTDEERVGYHEGLNRWRSWSRWRAVIIILCWHGFRE